MGGIGSTRWDDHEKKTTVEESLQLDIRLFRALERPSGSVRWHYRDGTERAAIEYRMPSGADGVLIRYSKGQQPVEEVLRFQTTRPHFGGVRRWFRCPVCGRRAVKLYLPPRESRFACRHCHELTYESVQLRGTWLGDVFRLWKSIGLL